MYYDRSEHAAHRMGVRAYGGVPEHTMRPLSLPQSPRPLASDAGLHSFNENRESIDGNTCDANSAHHYHIAHDSIDNLGCAPLRLEGGLP